MNKQHCFITKLPLILRWVLVDFSNQPLGNLLRGPLLHTPQGQVVIVVAIGYLALALLFGLDRTERAANLDFLAEDIGYGVAVFRLG